MIKKLIQHGTRVGVRTGDTIGHTLRNQSNPFVLQQKFARCPEAEKSLFKKPILQMVVLRCSNTRDGLALQHMLVYAQ